MKRADDVFERQQLSKLLSTDKIEVVGISGVNHKIEIYPVSFTDGQEIEKDLLRLKLICIDLDVPKGILVVTKDIKISEEIERMARNSEIILVKSVSEEDTEK